MTIWSSSWALNFRMGVTEVVFFYAPHSERDSKTVTMIQIVKSNYFFKVLNITSFVKIGFLVKGGSRVKVKFYLKRREGFRLRQRHIIFQMRFNLK